MMLRYAAVSLALSFASIMGAQGIVTLTDEEGHVVNGTVIVAPCDWSTDTVSLFAQLTGASPMTVNVRRYEMWPVTGTNNFYCWGVCYLPVTTGTYPTWVSQHYVDMNPGATYNNFHAYHQAEGITTTARYKFVWFDEANPSGPDSSWVDIDFCGLVGVNERVAQSTTLTVWPSPSQGQDLQLAYALDRSGGAHLVLYNVLGEAMRRTVIGGAQGRITWSTADLGPGVYFATLEREGRAMTTQRFVVTR